MRTKTIQTLIVITTLLAVPIFAGAQQKRPTAREVIADIQKQVGVAWQR